MTQKMILICSFLFLFAHSKQATYMHLVAHFVFIAAICVHCSHFPCYCEQAHVMSKYRNDGRVELDVERFPHKRKQNRTSMFWLIFIRALFPSFAEGFATITFNLTEYSPVECHIYYGLLAVRCTARVLQPSFLLICRTVFSNTSMLNFT